MHAYRRDTYMLLRLAVCIRRDGLERSLYRNAVVRVLLKYRG